jgi:DNA-binding CsgD family transcriptional regulator
MALRRTWLALGPGPQQGTRCYEAPLLIRLALATGDTATATATAAECREHLNATDDWALAARCGLALLDDDISALRGVAEGYQAYGWPLWTGLALEELAVRLAEAADTQGARTALADAVSAYAQTGATWDIRRAQGRLRRYGIRQRRPAAQPPARTGWSALTPAEQRVAGLVARGLSNPDIAAELFVSRNTVQTHVSRILAKLQLRSRIELVRAVMTSAGTGESTPGT